MRATVKLLLHQMEDSLDKIASEAVTAISKTKNSIQSVKDYLSLLKTEFDLNPFHSDEEKMSFFKNDKPMFEKYLYYFISKHRFEISQSTLSSEGLEKFIKKEMQQMEADIEWHREFYYYYKNGSAFLDSQYFIRANDDVLLFPHYIGWIDPSFGTVHSYLIAKFEANELYKRLLQNHKADYCSEQHSPGAAQSGVTWTGSHVDCVEFIYGMYVNRCLNNGKIALAEIAALVERTFNIKLNNVPRIFMDIKIRKIRTKYHNETIQNLNEFMDYSDEYPRFS